MYSTKNCTKNEQQFDNFPVKTKQKLSNFHEPLTLCPFKNSPDSSGIPLVDQIHEFDLQGG